jgi:hypothetical protein
MENSHEFLVIQFLCFSCHADSVCEFLITASAYVLMVGSETFLSVVCPAGPFPTIFIKLSFPTRSSFYSGNGDASGLMHVYDLPHFGE